MTPRATLPAVIALLRLALGCMALAALADRAQAATPPPAWSAYNEGVEAYAKGDFAGALQRWQDLSLQPLARGLQPPVWFQMGNAQFRLGEPLEQNAPEEAVEFWRRSCGAYRSLLTIKPRDANAAHNLALVEHRLARLTHRLGMESYNNALSKPPDDSIEQLRASLEYLNEAVGLAPSDPPLRQDRDRAEQALRERLRDRAQRAETKGDEAAQPNSQWRDREAEDEYRAALEDLADAAHAKPAEAAAAQRPAPAQASPSELDRSIRQAEQRVQQKLSQLLTRMGQREQKEGNQQAEWNPDQALDQYEAALSHFQQAQEVNPENAAARKGEREVREAMEQLHVKEGRQQLERGKEALAQQSPRAAPALTDALGNFEAAMELNPNNAEARQGAEEARNLLPAALAQAGQAEMRAGDRAEPNSPTDALNHYQESEKDFQQALDLKPGQAEATKGLKELEPKLARVRERVAKEAESIAKQNQPAKSLQSMLGRVEERDRPREVNRERQRGRKDTGRGAERPDW